MDFCLNAFEQHAPEEHKAVLSKIESVESDEQKDAAAAAAISVPGTEARVEKKAELDPEGLSADELRILKTIRARQMLRHEDTMNIDNFGSDSIDGYAPIVKRGSLGLIPAASTHVPKQPKLDLMDKVMEVKEAEVQIQMQEQALAIQAH